jgi:FMN phosphatase YigB (HAD superfamily)
VQTRAIRGLRSSGGVKFRLKRAGCAPSEAVMIGDRIDDDIRPARSLGWKTIRVTQGLHGPSRRGILAMSPI